MIGAGLSGLLCAHRLAQAGAEVTVYEANTRVGGRIFSVPLPTDPEKIACELGGEFIDTNHVAMLQLIDELGLSPEDRQHGAEGIDGELYRLNGESVSPALIATQFAGVAPAMVKALNLANEDRSALRLLDSTALAYWLALNVPSSEFPELAALLKVAFTSEFGLETDQQSALNLLFLAGSANLSSFSFHASVPDQAAHDQRIHVQGGNALITQKLTEALKPRVRTDARLVGIESIGTALNPLYSLSFQTQTQIPSHAQAERVVFALPFSALRRLDLGKLGLSDAKQSAIRELGYGTGSKLVGGFTSRIWRETHRRDGHVLGDFGFQELRESSIGPLAKQGVLTSLQGGDVGARANQTPVTDAMAALLAELEPIFPGVRAAFLPGSAQRMHWPSHPLFHGSISCYRPGQWALRDILGRREGNLHFCGEHCSLDFPGRLEGAAETGTLVAADIIENLELTASPPLARILEVKTAVPQPGFRDGDTGSLGILDRLLAVEDAHLPKR